MRGDVFSVFASCLLTNPSSSILNRLEIWLHALPPPPEPTPMNVEPPEAGVPRGGISPHISPCLPRSEALGAESVSLSPT